MNGAPRGAVEYSRGPEAENPVESPSGGRSSASTVLAVMALIGAAALIAATFLPVLRISIDDEVVSGLDRTGWDEHGAALLALAIFALALLRPALRGSRPAALAIALAGIAALAIAVASDLPDIGDTGALGNRLEAGKVGAGFGAYAETLGGILLVAAGGMLALISRDD